MTTNHSESFPPLVSGASRVLILGTLPGPESLRKGEYYANSRNSFWRLMERLFNIPTTLEYAFRTSRLMVAGVALWDVLAHAQRPGALDVNITDGVPNDFQTFLDAHPDIDLIFFNGAASAKLWEKLVVPTLAGRARMVPFKLLPSSSPAHAVSIDEKVAAWNVIAEHLRLSPAEHSHQRFLNRITDGDPNGVIQSPETPSPARADNSDS